MNLLNFDLANREAFAKTLQTLIKEHHLKPDEIYMNVLESTEEPQMNYWMARLLIEEQGVNPQQVLAHDAAGEPVKALQAACLLHNIGVAAALLELNAFKGSVVDREFQLAARIASKHEDQALLGLMMKYAQERDELDWFMQALQRHPTQ
ncbi:hypothetical protein JX580_10555 [Thiomicrospira microaerophila]|uniref:hypothetical protein n=1 Tax=Thiomicrospira microaerophila TaxID=406020 RepID=UPI00200C2A9B|nr:hypothetical protein [Thiomicrospira microaerophila]UQB42085.1 hypothetical protein JX580_10555 [Thiomicrospira microaerophila]